MIANPKSDDIPFELRGGMTPMTVLRVLSADYMAIARLLAEKVAKAPAMFKSAPVIIDLQAVNTLEQDADISRISALLREHGMVPVAVRNGNPVQEKAAVAGGIGVLHPDKPRLTAHKEGGTSESHNDPLPAVDASTASPSPPVVEKNPARIVNYPVRSGQQIYAQGSDLVVIGTVSPGAEVLADGCIHVYGALRGRALAGVRGDTSARVFCQDLGAELVSIAGCYQVNEAMPPMLFGKPVQIFFREDTLIFEPF